MSELSKVIIDPSLCIGCWKCAEDCPSLCLTVKQGTAVFNGERCLACGHCLAVCPRGAISMPIYPQDDVQPVSDYQPEPQKLLAAMRSRRSVRRFENRPVPREMLEMLIQAGRCSATAVNKQKLSYVVLTDSLPDVEAAAVRHFRDPEVAAGILHHGMGPEEVDDHFFFKGGKAVILINGSNKIDAGIAASKMETLANALGLGVFYCGFFARAATTSQEVRQMLGLGEEAKPATSLVLGWPKVKYVRTAPRKAPRVIWL